MTNLDSHLVLVTNNYPFFYNGGEVMFVHPELDYLVAAFSTVTIAPCHPCGSLTSNCEGIDLDVSLGTSFSRVLSKKLFYFLYAFIINRDLNVTKELVKAFRLHGWKGLQKAVLWTASAAATYIWLKKKIPRGKKAVVYTYWNADSTVGALWFSGSRKGSVKVVSRCHGYDLYEERNIPPYLPYRAYVYNTIDALIPISHAGAKHARECGMDPERIFVHRLGIKEQGGMCQPSFDGVFRICSCSSVVPVKRVPYIAESVIEFARRNPNSVIEWTHFGAGPSSSLVIEKIKIAPKNLKANLKGAVSNSDIILYYRKSPVDVFINLSESEGIPVSIMEVCSFGIPVIATDVGGVSEIVSSDNGVLLSSNPTLEEVVCALTVLLKGKKNLRSGSREIWEKKFDSKVVHKNFSLYLKNLTV